MKEKKIIPEGCNYYPENSNVGKISDYTAGEFYVSDITLPEIQKAIGEPNLKSLWALARSSKVNRHALFSPKYPNWGDRVSFGDWGGYNHNAMPATYFYY